METPWALLEALPRQDPSVPFAASLAPLTPLPCRTEDATVQREYIPACFTIECLQVKVKGIVAQSVRV